MQTKNLCVLIHIWTKGEVGAPLNRFKPPSKIFYWPFQGGTSFVDLLCVFFSALCLLCFYASVYRCLVVTYWERAGLLALVCGVKLWIRYFPIGILGQVWYLIVSIPDFCTLAYFVKLFLNFNTDTQSWLLKTILVKNPSAQDISELAFYADLVYKFKELLKSLVLMINLKR